ncbi:virulence factor Mce-like protein [Saccharomonospora amisosensis]|uniref:Virulence factor Mce-like protein n=1 Tax=Saccharomonospora amisosensis TaxID=1128677 RepID=A0A7X5UV95_9PSEU|nr:MCE family protein [Saccharomonospora amisosensis]NIJ14896.1 virulence factor Mce-like protein [Saccharomonospora amisosensis]
MVIDSRASRRTYRWVATAAVVVLVLTGALWWAFGDGAGTRLSAYFTKAVGLYPGSSVRVLGIEVGEITAVVPEGQRVRVDMTVADDVPLPRSAGAVIVAPSLVSDRYVQLTPPYDGGPRLRSGDTIALDRTATPMEIDDLYRTLDELSTTLGPKGANSDGSLSRVLDAAAESLEGNGKNLNTTITHMSELAETLNSSKGDLFSTVRNLSSFTEVLARSEAQLEEFYARLDQVSGFLAGESDEVSAALSSLGSALGDVKRFVTDNRDQLTSNVDKLASLTQVLVDERASLAETLDVGPTGLTNFINTYDANSGSIAIRYNANELTNPLVTTACRLVKLASSQQVPESLNKLCEVLAPVVDGTTKIPPVSQLLHAIQTGELPPLPLPLITAGAP